MSYPGEGSIAHGKGVYYAVFGWDASCVCVCVCVCVYGSKLKVHQQMNG